MRRIPASRLLVAGSCLLPIATGFLKPSFCLRSCCTRLSSTSESSSDTFTPKKSWTAPPLLVGGDFAGLSATFDCHQGKLIPVPEHWIPPSLLEWGQEPSCVEVLVSEDTFDSRLREWSRQTLTILPETGCGIDNLETIKTNQEMEAYCIWKDDRETVQQSLHDDDDGMKLHLETMFGWIPQHRVRISVNVVRQEDDTSSWSVQDPVTVVLERQFDTESSEGSRASGGGLDGQRVSKWMGEVLQKSHSFAKQNVGRWNAQTDLPTIVLPGNLTLSYGLQNNEEWIVEMGHIWPDEQVRHVVRRTFTSMDDFTVESWVEQGEYQMK